MLLAALVASAGVMVHVGAPPRSAVARSRVLMQQEPESDRYNFADPRPLLKSFFLRDEPTPSFYTGLKARAGADTGVDHRVTPVDQSEPDDFTVQTDLARMERPADLAAALIHLRGASESRELLWEALKLVRKEEKDASGTSDWRNQVTGVVSKGSAFFNIGGKKEKEKDKKNPYYTGL